MRTAETVGKEACDDTARLPHFRGGFSYPELCTHAVRIRDDELRIMIYVYVQRLWAGLNIIDKAGDEDTVRKGSDLCWKVANEMFNDFGCVIVNPQNVLDGEKVKR